MSKTTLLKELEQQFELNKIKVNSKLGSEIYRKLLKLDMDKSWSYWDLTANIHDIVTTAVAQAEERVKQQVLDEKITEDTSDGYHTFKELYEFRKLYNAALFNEFYQHGHRDVHKSKRHHDGELCFGGGWFIVMATLPDGQISNHYELKDWNLFHCEERERSDEWDGHTSQDVVERLTKFIKRGWNT